MAPPASQDGISNKQRLRVDRYDSRPQVGYNEISLFDCSIILENLLVCRGEQATLNKRQAYGFREAHQQAFVSFRSGASQIMASSVFYPKYPTALQENCPVHLTRLFRARICRQHNCTLPVQLTRVNFSPSGLPPIFRIEI